MHVPGAPPLRLDPESVGRAIGAGGRVLDHFLFEHRRSVTRLLGALDMFVGLGETVTGARLAGVGAAASEGGVGVPVLLAGGWMVGHGYDASVAGWRALITGEPQKTTTQKLLRRLGLTDGQADAAEVTLSVLSGGIAVRGGRKFLDQAVNRELARRALLAFDERAALTVGAQGKSLWTEANIRERGDLWEIFDAKRTGYLRTPNAKAFDQISPDGRVAISNKTLDLQRETYLRTDRKGLYKKLRSYINDAASFAPVHPLTKEVLKSPERRLNLLLRFGDSVEGQALQIAAAEQYAKEMGVILKVEYAF